MCQNEHWGAIAAPKEVDSTFSVLYRPMSRHSFWISSYIISPTHSNFLLSYFSH